MMAGTSVKRLSDYQDNYSQIALERDEYGVLVVRIHSSGGPARWSPTGGGLLTQLGAAFADIAADEDNRAVVFTGTGDRFSTDFEAAATGGETVRFDARRWDRIMRESRALMNGFLDIPVPIVGAVNGPAHIHAQLIALSDIVIAAQHTTFADRTHFTSSIVPGDGVHTIWPMLLGLSRARTFLLTGHDIAAEEARQIGFVSEVLPGERVLDRALELAGAIAAQPDVVRRYTRQLFTRSIRRRLQDDLDLGLALEGLAILDLQDHAAWRTDFIK